MVEWNSGGGIVCLFAQSSRIGVHQMKNGLLVICSCALAMHVLDSGREIYGLEASATNAPTKCSSLAIQWKRQRNGDSDSQIDLTIRNDTDESILFLATEEPHRIHLDWPRDDGLCDGFSFSGRAYSRSPIVLPALLLYEMRPGEGAVVSRQVRRHRKAFMVEFGVINESRRKEYQSLKKVDGTTTYYSALPSFVTLFDTIELWIHEDSNEGQRSFIIGEMNTKQE